ACFGSGKIGRSCRPSSSGIFPSLRISAKSDSPSRIPLFVSALIIPYCRILHKARLLVFPIPIAPVLRSDSPGGEPRRLGQEARALAPRVGQPMWRIRSMKFLGLKGLRSLAGAGVVLFLTVGIGRAGDNDADLRKLVEE